MMSTKRWPLLLKYVGSFHISVSFYLSIRLLHVFHPQPPTWLWLCVVASLPYRCPCFFNCPGGHDHKAEEMRGHYCGQKMAQKKWSRKDADNGWGRRRRGGGGGGWPTDHCLHWNRFQPPPFSLLLPWYYKLAMLSLVQSVHLTPVQGAWRRVSLFSAWNWWIEVVIRTSHNGRKQFGRPSLRFIGGED